MGTIQGVFQQIPVVSSIFLREHPTADLSQPPSDVEPAEQRSDADKSYRRLLAFPHAQFVSNHFGTVVTSTSRIIVVGNASTNATGTVNMMYIQMLLTSNVRSSPDLLQCCLAARCYHVRLPELQHQLLNR